MPLCIARSSLVYLRVQWSSCSLALAGFCGIFLRPLIFLSRRAPVRCLSDASHVQIILELFPSADCEMELVKFISRKRHWVPWHNLGWWGRPQRCFGGNPGKKRDADTPEQLLHSPEMVGRLCCKPQRRQGCPTPGPPGPLKDGLEIHQLLSGAGQGRGLRKASRSPSAMNRVLGPPMSSPAGPSGGSQTGGGDRNYQNF